jgi:heme a synthase
MKLFRITGIISIVMIFIVITLGGTVRSTVAGMGCPDWPKCFGQWIPPTDVSELPANYQEIYADRGYAIMEFNASKTWTEYVNRLSGALTGFLLIIFFVLSFYFRNKDPKIILLSFASLALVSFQGWIGAKVVASNLAEMMITVHLFLAMLLVAVVIYTVLRSYQEKLNLECRFTDLKKIRLLMFITFGLFLLQVISGTQVRAELGEVLKSSGGFNFISIISSSLSYSFHRIISILIAASTFFLVFSLKKHFTSSFILWKANAILVVMLLQVITGVVMVYFDLPAAAQVLHMLFSTIYFGLLFSLSVVLLNYTSVTENDKIINLQSLAG